MNRKPSLPRLLAVLLLAVLILVPAVPALAEEAGMRPEIKFSGVIETVPTAADQPWVIAGVSVAVNGQTQIRLTGGAAAAGMWADVTATRQLTGGLLASKIFVLPAEVRLKGPIQARPADPGVGNWTIAGRTIAVTADTKMSTRGAALEVGNWAEVFVVEKPAGVLTAVRMRGLDAPQRQIVEIYGAIQSFGAAGWMLSSIPISVTATTNVLGTPALNLLAQASAQIEEGSNLLVAENIRVLWLDSSAIKRPVTFTGPIEQVAGGNLNGAWKVAGRDVVVSDTTVIHQEHGPAVVGSQATVIGLQDGTQVKASQILVLRGPAWDDNYTFFIGRISELPVGSLLGVWKIGERQVTVNTDTRVEGGRYALVGAVVEVGALEQADESLAAAWVRVLPIGPRPHDAPDIEPGDMSVVE
jgi:hypothetical protein